MSEAIKELDQLIKDEGTDVLLNDEIKDPACDPDVPVFVDQVAIWDAYSEMKRAHADIKRTPCTRSRLSDSLGTEIYFKKDFMQVTGSFKERGARYSASKNNNKMKNKGKKPESASFQP